MQVGSPAAAVGAAPVVAPLCNQGHAHPLASDVAASVLEVVGPSSEDRAVIRRYAEAMRRRGFTDETVKWKRSILEHFAGWLAPVGLGDATYLDVEAYLDTLRVAARTRYHRVSQMHVFYEFAIAHELLERDPTLRVVRPKLAPLFPRPIGDEDLAFALDQVDAPDRRAWLLLMAYGGFRCCEVARLDRADILDTNEPPVFVVRGKGRKDRVVPAHPVILEELRRAGLPTRGRVFHRPMGGVVSPKFVSAHTARLFAELGINGTAHQLRHWFGSRLYGETRDIRLVQELMGHSDPKTTAIYTAWADDKAYGAVVQLDAERARRSPRGVGLPKIALPSAVAGA